MSPPWTADTSFEQVFLANLALIDRIISSIGRRHGVGGDDLEDFRSAVKLRLIEDNYAVLRKFGGRSSLATYLTVVLVNLFRDDRNSRWGRWRPSAAALRLGPIAVRLEQLVYRDKHTLAEAIALLISAGVPSTARELTQLFGLIPIRVTPRETSLDAVEAPGIPDPATEDGFWGSHFGERGQLTDRVRRVVGELPTEEQVIVRMRFWDRLSVADISRILGLDQKALYRRIEGIQNRLRSRLTSEGVDRAQVLAVLDEEPS